MFELNLYQKLNDQIINEQLDEMAYFDKNEGIDLAVINKDYQIQSQLKSPQKKKKVHIEFQINENRQNAKTLNNFSRDDFFTH